MRKNLFEGVSLRRQVVAFLMLCCLGVTALVLVIGNEYDDLTVLAEQLNQAGRLRMLSQRTLLEAEAVLRDEPGSAEALRRTLVDFEQILTMQLAQQRAGVAGSDGPALDTLERAWTALKLGSEAALERLQNEDRQAYSHQEMRRLSNNTLDAAESNVQRLLPRFEQARRQLRWLLPVTLLVGTLLTILVYSFISARLLSPISRLRQMLDKLGSGDLAARVTVQSEDEIGILFSHANQAADTLEQSQRMQANGVEQLRDSELRNRTLWEITNDAITVLDVDSVIRFANPSVRTIFGYEPKELIGKHIEILQPLSLRKAHQEGMRRYQQSGERRLNWSNVETSALHKAGHEINVDLSFSQMQLTNTQWFVGTFRDTTQRKMEQERLRLNERAMEATGEGILITDAQESGHPIIYANQAISAISGFLNADVLGKSGRIFFSEEDLRTAEVATLRRLLKSGSTGTVTVRCHGIDGSPFWNELSVAPVLDAKNRVTHFVSILKDVTERKRNEEALVRSANYDALTGLPNRVLLNDRIDQELVSAKRYQRSFGVLAIDLDNFKIVNDNLGHDAGDLLLCEARDRLMACVRDNDTVSRIGGDEFLLLLSELVDQSDVDTLAQRVLISMEKPFSISSSEVFVGASIGAAIYPRDGTSRSELLQHADIAMYRAKDQGRNNYQHYAEHMQTRFKVRLSMETQLRRALENEEFVLHYQPQIEVSSGRIAGAEALIRWNSPALGMVSPAQFIPLAEETGLIVPIGAWVIDRAMHDVKTWSELAGGENCQVAINMSARQFNQLDLMDVVSRGLQKYELMGSRVELEITESLVMSSPQKAAQLLGRWRELGCHIAIDDFGTGYSSLAYLRNFPVDCLKIDKTLIGDAAIVKAVIELAHSFGMSTVAEGVEDVDVLETLMQLGCDVIQGYYYSPPLPLDAFVAYLNAPHVAASGAQILAHHRGKE